MYVHLYINRSGGLLTLLDFLTGSDVNLVGFVLTVTGFCLLHMGVGLLVKLFSNCVLLLDVSDVFVLKMI